VHLYQRKNYIDFKENSSFVSDEKMNKEYFQNINYNNSDSEDIVKNKDL
jgi:hypothetical protein